MRNFLLVLCMIVSAACMAQQVQSDPLRGFFDETERAAQKANLENRLRMVREDALIQAERDRLEQERWERLHKQNQAATQAHNPPRWDEIQAKAEFANLSPELQAETKRAYFDRYIAPLVGQAAPDLRKQFLGQNAPWHQSAIESIKIYWPYIFIAFALLFVVMFRKQVAVAGAYVVNNATRLAALIAAVALLMIAWRSLQGPLFRGPLF